MSGIPPEVSRPLKQLMLKNEAERTTEIMQAAGTRDIADPQVAAEVAAEVSAQRIARASVALARFNTLTEEQQLDILTASLSGGVEDPTLDEINFDDLD